MDLRNIIKNIHTVKDVLITSQYLRHNDAENITFDIECRDIKRLHRIIKDIIMGERGLLDKINLLHLQCILQCMDYFASADKTCWTEEVLEEVARLVAVVVRVSKTAMVSEDSIECLCAELLLSLTSTILTLANVGIKVRRSLVGLLSPILLDVISDHTYTLRCRTVVVHAMNKFLENTSRDTRFKVQDKLHAQLVALAGDLAFCGDRCFQEYLAELLYRLHRSKEEIQEISTHITCSTEILELFVNIQSDSFDVDLQKFLNRLNASLKNDQLVYSLACMPPVTVDIKQLTGPVNDDVPIWVHFSLTSGAVSACVNGPSVEGPSVEGQEREQVVLTCSQQTVQQATLVYIKERDVFRLQFLLTQKHRPHGGVHTEFADIGQVMTMFVKERTPQLQQLHDTVLPRLYGKRYQGPESGVSIGARNPVSRSVDDYGSSSDVSVGLEQLMTGRKEPMGGKVVVEKTPRGSSVGDLSAKSSVASSHCPEPKTVWQIVISDSDVSQASSPPKQKVKKLRMRKSISPISGDSLDEMQQNERGRTVPVLSMISEVPSLNISIGNSLDAGKENRVGNNTRDSINQLKVNLEAIGKNKSYSGARALESASSNAEQDTMRHITESTANGNKPQQSKAKAPVSRPRSPLRDLLRKPNMQDAAEKKTSVPAKANHRDEPSKSATMDPTSVCSDVEDDALDSAAQLAAQPSARNALAKRRLYKPCETVVEFNLSGSVTEAASQPGKYGPNNLQKGLKAAENLVKPSAVKRSKHKDPKVINEDKTKVKQGKKASRRRERKADNIDEYLFGRTKSEEVLKPNNDQFEYDGKDCFDNLFLVGIHKPEQASVPLSSQPHADQDCYIIESDTTDELLIKKLAAESKSEVLVTVSGVRDLTKKGKSRNPAQDQKRMPLKKEISVDESFEPFPDLIDGTDKSKVGKARGKMAHGDKMLVVKDDSKKAHRDKMYMVKNDSKKAKGDKIPVVKDDSKKAKGDKMYLVIDDSKKAKRDKIPVVVDDSKKAKGDKILLVKDSRKTTQEDSYTSRLSHEPVDMMRSLNESCESPATPSDPVITPVSLVNSSNGEFCTSDDLPLCALRSPLCDISNASALKKGAQVHKGTRSTPKAKREDVKVSKDATTKAIKRPWKLIGSGNDCCSEDPNEISESLKVPTGPRLTCDSSDDETLAVQPGPEKRPKLSLVTTECKVAAAKMPSARGTASATMDKDLYKSQSNTEQQATALSPVFQSATTHKRKRNTTSTLSATRQISSIDTENTLQPQFNKPTGGSEVKFRSQVADISVGMHIPISSSRAEPANMLEDLLKSYERVEDPVTDQNGCNAPNRMNESRIQELIASSLAVIQRPLQDYNEMMLMDGQQVASQKVPTDFQQMQEKTDAYQHDIAAELAKIETNRKVLAENYKRLLDLTVQFKEDKRKIEDNIKKILLTIGQMTMEYQEVINGLFEEQAED